MSKTRTPGSMYVVAQIHANDLQWTVQQVSAAQGRAMKRRGVPHVFFTSAEAHTMRNKLQRKRKRQRELFDLTRADDPPQDYGYHKVEESAFGEIEALREARERNPVTFVPTGKIDMEKLRCEPLSFANHKRTAKIIQDALNKEKS